MGLNCTFVGKSMISMGNYKKQFGTVDFLFAKIIINIESYFVIVKDGDHNGLL